MGNTVWDYVASEASSSTTGGWNTAEGQDPSTVNDGMRQHKQNVYNLLRDFGGGTTTAGSANAQTVTLNQAIATTIPTNFIFRVKIGSGLTNTSSTVTLNVNSIGAKTVKVINTYGGLADPPIESIVAGRYADFLYDGTYLVILNPALATPNLSTGLAASVAASALTIAIPGLTSLVISSGSTMGTTSNVAFRLWVVVFDDAGTQRIGAINCLSGTSIYPLGGMVSASSTAEGGAGGADSAHVFYTGTAVTSKSYTIVGYLEWPSGLGTAGTWSAGPTTTKLYTPGDKKPGDVVQVQRTDTGILATGTGTIPVDNTIPQNTEGDQYMSVTGTPTSAANLWDVDAQFVGGQAPGSAYDFVVALFEDSVANALKASTIAIYASGVPGIFPISHVALCGGTSSKTFKLRAGGPTAGTTSFNGNGGSQRMGGVSNSFMQIKEIMA